MSGRYRKVPTRIWTDPKFKALSKNAQLLYFFLLTGPHTTALPGAFGAGEAGLAESLRWQMKSFRQAFSELSTLGIVIADFENRLVFIPAALADNSPESPNVVVAWRKSFDELPTCDLKSQIHGAVKDFLEALKVGKKAAFLKAFHEDFVKSFPESRTE